MTHYNTVIIGAGFTGLAESKLLQQNGISHTVLEKIDKLGSFLHQTWDSFRFGMTIDDFKLPGMDLTKKFPKGHRLTRDEALDVIRNYADGFPIRFNTDVKSLTPDANGMFHLYIETTVIDPYKKTKRLITETITANHVVICTGPHHAAQFPQWAQVFQHKATVISRFKNPDSFKDHARILIVGGGLSALSVAYDLKKQTKKPLQIIIACGRNDKEIIAENTHLLQDRPDHLMKMLPSHFKENGIFNMGRVLSTNHEDILFEATAGKYLFPFSYFDHIILAVGFTHSFSLFKEFPQIKIKNNLPEHDKCKTTVPNLFVAGIAHTGQKDRVVTINQGTEDAKTVHAYIVRSKL